MIENSALKSILTLVESGEGRLLPERMFGYQVIPYYEHIIDDPAKRPLIREMSCALVRFPGGYVGGFYNWHTGQLEVPSQGIYDPHNFWKPIARATRTQFPHGIFMKKYHDFCVDVGSEIIFLPNMITSTIPDQVAWVREIRDAGLMPRRIELGQEFWLTDSLMTRKFPDGPAAMKVMKAFRDALEPFYIDNTLVAVQAAGYRFWDAVVDGNLVSVPRFKAWDDGLKNEPWFDAVTVHMYPWVDRVVGRGERQKLPGNMPKAFSAMMARCDSGVMETLSLIEKQVPGKEIWITEWAGRSGMLGNHGSYGMNMHMTVRMVLSMLQNKSVTMALYDKLMFTGGWNAIFTPAGRSSNGLRTFKPIGPCIILKWFHQAANGGVKYQRLEVKGAQKIPSSTTPLESYYDVEAARFEKEGKVTIIIHNASGINRELTLSQLMKGSPPTKIEVMIMNLTEDYSSASPPVQSALVSSKLEIPAYSLTRLQWN